MSGVLNKLLRSRYIFPLLLVVIVFSSPLPAQPLTKNFAQPVLPAQLTLSQDSNRLEIVTDNTIWVLQLERTSLLGSNELLQTALFDLPFFYRGAELGKLNSWVRLSSELDLLDNKNIALDEASLSGHIFVDGSLYQLNYEPLTGYSLVPLESSHPQGINLSSRKAISQSSIPSSSPALSGPALHKAIKIGIVIDSHYDDYYNGRGLAEALSIINGVDGLFQDQLGLAITVERFRYFNDANTDPLRSFDGSMEEMLNEFRSNRIADNELTPDLALVHLFSGNSDPSQPIGLSWIGTLCQTDGYDVSVSTPFPYNMLLSAHEIAHNLGAVHDNEPRCLVDTSITGNEVMWSELSHNTTSVFSHCSIESMRTALSSSCVADNIDLSMSIISAPTENLFEQDVIVSATNWDTSRVARQIISVTEFPESIQLSSLSAGCSVSGTTLTCNHGNVSLYSTSSATVSALYANSNPVVIRGEIQHPEFMDTNSNNNKAAVQVDFNARTSSANALAANDDDENQNVESGGSAGIGRFGPFSLLGLMLLFVPITVARK